MTVTDGDMDSPRRLLEEARDELLVVMRSPGTLAKELPAVVRELRMVLAELHSLPSSKKDTPTDEIAARREERRRKAAGE